MSHMNVPLNEEDAAAVKRARMLVSAVASKALRKDLGALLDGDPGGARKGPDYDWLQDGSIDEALLRDTANRLKSVLDSDLITRIGRLERMPDTEPERVAMSQRIAAIVFERVAPKKSLTESELNAAVAMFVDDVAIVRRDCVDSGYLVRTSDGGKYARSELASS